jgi:hypothetical protein
MMDPPQEGKGPPKWKPSQCIPKAMEIPKYEIHSMRVGSYVQCMKDHAFIRKFIGPWPSKRDLIAWISSHWKPRD